MERHEKIFLTLSVLQFFGFLIVATSAGGHGAGFVILIFFIFSIMMAIMGMTLAYEARKKGDVFWMLVVATVLSCVYIIYIWN